MIKKYVFSSLFLTFLWLCSACTAVRTVVYPPAPDIRAGREAQMLTQVTALGVDGDWLVIRGYKSTDNFVVRFTSMPFSHVALYDATRREVLEAEKIGVHATPLAEYVKKAWRLLLVRPSWATAGAGVRAVARGRTLVGKTFDYLGLIGLNNPDKYYCSELTLKVYEGSIPADEPIPAVIAPGQLLFWGTILYDSGPPESPAPSAYQ
jgi:hypothetical protein